ncbi:MAG TPA: AraC family transcriptional regulator, partial [Chitinophagaceae bacterium]|nr:AraC family transcriptional regulator [Chitinophagaceae bacterium]
MQDTIAVPGKREEQIAVLGLNPYCISPRECNFGEGVEFSCKFLCNETDRGKIVKARDILLQQLGEPLTIKELSRKVAINECYLKKGFKELFGATIFDFYQSERMQYARYLLYEKGLSVTEVSFMLGYSSISH